MCASGQVQYTGTTTGFLTYNKHYDIVAVSPQGGTGAGSYLSIVADNGKFYSVDSTDANFSLTGLYVSGKVV